MKWFVLFFPHLLFASPTADEIVKRADEIRNPSDNYSLTAEVESDGDTSQFEVLVSGTRTLIRTIKPSRDRGRNLLMLGEQMWAYVPNLKRSVRISLSQKLSGQAANGDISRMRWTGDYSMTLESESGSEYVVAMKAGKKGLTYEALRAWIDKKTFRPVRAEFLTPQGKLLKHAHYQKYSMMAGKDRPSEMVIEDAVRKDAKSIIRLRDMKNREFNDAIFDQNNLGKTE